MTHEARDQRQRQVAEWCAAAFGTDHASSVAQRGVRLLEEAIEAYQAAGATADMAHRLVDHVFSQPPGELRQELGGVGITLLALAAASGESADAAEAAELARVLAKPLEHFKARNEKKNALGFNVAGGAPAQPNRAPFPPMRDDEETVVSGAQARSINESITGLWGEIERLQGMVYVPGLWRCPKCKFSLMQRNLNAADGTVTARDEPGDKCPNCAGPLWRVSERDAGNDMIDRADAAFEDKRVAEARATDATSLATELAEELADARYRIADLSNVLSRAPDLYRMDFLLGRARSAGLLQDSETAPTGSGWRDMAEAPKDGRSLLLYARAHHATAPVRLVGWWTPDSGWVELSFLTPVGVVPFAWQPLPGIPPTAPGAGRT